MFNELGGFVIIIISILL